MSEEAVAAEVLPGVVLSTPSIFEAFAAAQAEFPVIKTNKVAKVKSKKTGVEFEYPYCSLDLILDSVRGPLTKRGLFLRHVITRNDGVLWVEAIINDGDGAELRSGALPIPEWEHLQDLGGGLTYTRRYTANALLGICPEEDLDGQNSPTGNPFRDQQNAAGRGAKRQAAAPPGAQPSEQAAPAKAKDPFIQAQQKFVKSKDAVEFDVFLKHCQESEKLKGDLPLLKNIILFAGNHAEARKQKGNFKADDPAVQTIFDRLAAMSDAYDALAAQNASTAAPTATHQPGMF